MRAAFTFLTFGLLLCGCAVGPNYKRPAIDAPGAYRGDKMSHTPVTLLRAAPGQSWVRLDGFATADDLYAEVQQLRSAALSH